MKEKKFLHYEQENISTGFQTRKFAPKNIPGTFTLSFKVTKSRYKVRSLTFIWCDSKHQLWKSITKKRNRFTCFMKKCLQITLQKVKKWERKTFSVVKSFVKNLEYSEHFLRKCLELILQDVKQKSNKILQRVVLLWTGSTQVHLWESIHKSLKKLTKFYREWSSWKVFCYELGALRSAREEI